MYIKIIITLILTFLLSLILIKVSKKIGYSYGSKNKEFISIVISVLYSGILSYFARISNPMISLKGEIYLSLFIVTSVISISSSFIDLKYKEIPDSYNLATAIVGAISIALFPQFVSTAILAAGIMFGMYFLIMIITNAMGGGDVKMAGALGIMVPITHLSKFLITPFAFGTIIALYLIVFKKQDKKSKIPFGPYIALGYLFTVFVYWVL